MPRMLGLDESAMTEVVRPAEPKLRMVDFFVGVDGVRAEVYKKSLGHRGIVIIEGNAQDGQPSETVLSAREAMDLMLWLKCALGQT